MDTLESARTPHDLVVLTFAHLSQEHTTVPMGDRFAADSQKSVLPPSMCHVTIAFHTIGSNVGFRPAFAKHRILHAMFDLFETLDTSKLSIFRHGTPVTLLRVLGYLQSALRSRTCLILKIPRRGSACTAVPARGRHGEIDDLGHRCVDEGNGGS